MEHLPHWQFVENVVAAIEAFANGKVADLTVTPKAMIPMRHHPDVPREVDVLVTFRVGPRTFRVGVDVKAEKAPVDIVLLEGLWAKAEHLNLDRYSVVSLSGFTKNARLVYGAKGVELVTLEQVASFEWAGLTHFTQVRRTVAFETMEFDYGGPDGGPPEEVMQRNRAWTVMLPGAQRPVSWPDYLAQNVGRALPLPPGAQPEDSADPFAVCLIFDAEARKVVFVRDGDERVELPHRVVVTGRFRREERHHFLEKFRSEGEEVMSTVLDVPGWNGGLHQVTLGRSPDEGQGRGLVMQFVPAVPKRTQVE